jgi:hypothetical protein
MKEILLVALDLILMIIILLLLIRLYKKTKK